MAGTGETYVRSDGKFAFRVKASNGQIVATDGSQGYDIRTNAKSTLANVMAGAYKDHEVYPRTDGKYAFRIKAGNGQVVATDGGQGYSARSDAESTASNITKGEYNGPITDL
jgi:uncharacterized protein YegP (UPF0339 family)